MGRAPNIISCDHCGVDFKRCPSHVARYEKHYCSNTCRSLDERKRVRVCCEVCGEEFEKYPSVIKKTSHDYCSRDCTGKARRGLLYSANKKHRRPIEVDAWAVQVKIEADFTCIKCNERGGNLHSHHIQPYADFKELRVDTDNGACLCEECHRNYHKEYGNKGANFETFIAWLSGGDSNF